MSEWDADAREKEWVDTKDNDLLESFLDEGVVLEAEREFCVGVECG